MKYGSILLGALGGFATGAILGVMLAPDSGKNTRKKISDGTRHASEDVKEKFNDFIDDLSERVDDGSGYVHQQTEKFRKSAKKNLQNARR